MGGSSMWLWAFSQKGAGNHVGVLARQPGYA